MNYLERLNTESLILRPFSLADYEAVHSWASNPENVRYMSFEPSGEDETKNFITTTKLGKDFIIALKDTGKVIGSCGIYPNDVKKSASLGWILHMDYWQQGYGTEICRELIRYGFEDLNLRRIYAYCAAANHASYKIMERNGMRREALHIKSHWSKVDKEWVDDAVYAILADEYRGSALL